jgi:transposase InsO family protein
MLGWSFTPRCRVRDFSPAMEQAWFTAWPYGPETPPTVVLRHDNGTQFTSEHYREVVRRLGIRLSRTRYRHPDGNALVERIFLSLKQEEVWPQDSASFAEAQAAVTHWILDYNTERPHQSLKYRTPAEVRQEALGSTQSRDVSTAGRGSKRLQPWHAQFSDWMSLIAITRSNTGSILAKHDRNR